LGCHVGSVCGFGDEEEEYMDVPDDGLPAGSLISVRLDLDKKTLTFGLNGKWQHKPAKTDIAPNTWYPYVQISKIFLQVSRQTAIIIIVR
jgi:hypothetical protein